MDTTPGTAAEAAARSGVTVLVATSDDLPAVLAVQHEGFGRIASRFGIPLDVLPPTRETLEDLRRLRAVGTRTFVAIADGTVVGTVRAELRDDGAVEIGRLAVRDNHLRRGIALALMLALEESYPEVRRFELFTGAGAAEPLALYGKLGYAVFRETAQGHVPIVWLARERPPAPSLPTTPHAPPLH
jgi:predicted N-acetyltransferase YhbS